MGQKTKQKNALPVIYTERAFFIPAALGTFASGRGQLKRLY